MKKIEHLILMSITLIFIGLMIGVLIGRTGNNHPVIVSKYQSTTSENVANDTAGNNKAEPGKMNINFASAEELALLPGIGETYAQRIVEYRKEYGPYLTIYDQEKVKGIGKKRIDTIAQYITVGG